MGQVSVFYDRYAKPAPEQQKLQISFIFRLERPLKQNPYLAVVRPPKAPVCTSISGFGATVGATTFYREASFNAPSNSFTLAWRVAICCD